jgi:hypothetical protein
MSSTSEPVHLSNHHRNTLRQIFEHPVSHNVEWRAVVSLLEAVGSVVDRHDGKVAVTVGSQAAFFDPPADKDIDTQAVVDLRRMLSAAGYSPASKDVLLWLTRSSARTSRSGRRPGPCGLLAGGRPCRRLRLRRCNVPHQTPEDATSPGHIGPANGAAIANGTTACQEPGDRSWSASSSPVTGSRTM